MARKPRNEIFYQLKKPKIRASWNVKNLYNLWRQREQNTAGPATFFQQKFEAKSLTRAYHGEMVKEKKWQRLFSRHIPAVAELRAADLGEQDGSVQSAGRGAGLDSRDALEPAKARPLNITPYMAHTYWILERRLDVAIFRALFASSARQARQLVVHGHVLVNGKKMRHPSYLLNPGDMFSVDPEKVMGATGGLKSLAWVQRRNNNEKQLKERAESKTGKEGEAEKKSAITAKIESITEAQSDVSSAESSTSGEAAAQAAENEVVDDDDVELTEDWEEDHVEEEKVSTSKGSSPPPTPEELKARKRTIAELHALTRDAEEEYSPSAKQKIALREIRKTLRTLMSRARRTTAAEIDAAAISLEDLVIEIEARAAVGRSREPEIVKPFRFADASKDGQKKEQREQELSPHMLQLGEIATENVDRWMPKNFMAPFAFVPRYLEVNHTVCSAVYLRHPSVRTGSSEVPSPFSLETGSLAFAWYLRRR